VSQNGGRMRKEILKFDKRDRDLKFGFFNKLKLNWMINIYYKIPRLIIQSPISFVLPDDRSARWANERKERRYDERCLWCLDSSICHYIVPRLKEFRKFEADSNGDPTWLEILDTMVEGFEIGANYEDIVLSMEEEKKVSRAFELLAENHRGLWN